MGPISGAARARLDLVGLVLGAATVLWTYLAATSLGGSAGPFVALVLASAAALVLGRLTASILRLLIPAVVVGAAAVVVVSTPDVLSSHPLSEPFRYANAKGAFFVQAAIAGLMLAKGARPVPLKVLGAAAALVFGFVPFAAESWTAAGLVLLLGIAALTLPASVAMRTATVGGGALFIGALALTIVLGLFYAPGDRRGLVDRTVDSTLTERRVALWHEALVIMDDHPVAGAGLGSFQVLSPTARSDRDARWAHNSFLQHGAETGVVGLVLLASLFVWGFVRLGATPTPDAISVLGALALVALGIHACVDYILHFPAVPITAAALVGAAMADPGRSGAFMEARPSSREIVEGDK